MTIIEIEAYNKLPLGADYDWVTATTFEDALRQVRRKVGEVVYHWRNLWAFEVTE